MVSAATSPAASEGAVGVGRPARGRERVVRPGLPRVADAGGAAAEGRRGVLAAEEGRVRGRAGGVLLVGV